jgi:hypothetical protein
MLRVRGQEGYPPGAAFAGEVADGQGVDGGGEEALSDPGGPEHPPWANVDSGWLLTLTVDASRGLVGAFRDAFPLVMDTVGALAVDGLCQRVVGVLGESCLDLAGVAERYLGGGAGVTVPGVDQVFQGSPDEGCG